MIRMPYDENFRSIVEAVETQLKLGVRIPAEFSEYGIKAIERWWIEGYKWFKGGRRSFADPSNDQVESYEQLRVFYSGLIIDGLKKKCGKEDFQHPEIQNLKSHPKKLEREQQQTKEEKNEYKIEVCKELPRWA